MHSPPCRSGMRGRTRECRAWMLAGVRRQLLTDAPKHTLSCTKLTMQQCGIELLCNGRERQNREGKLQASGWNRVLLCRPPAVCVCLSRHMRFKLVEWCRGIYLNNKHN